MDDAPHPITTATADTARAMHAAEMRGQDMQDAELVAQLRGRHRFCIDRGEIKTPELLCESADRIEALAAELAECQRRIDAAVQAEREACAEIAWDFDAKRFKETYTAKYTKKRFDVFGLESARNNALNIQSEDVADAIRARGQK